MGIKIIGTNPDHPKAKCAPDKIKYYCVFNPMNYAMEKFCAEQGDVIRTESLEGIVWHWVCKISKKSR